MRLRRVAQFRPLLREVQRRLVEISIASVVKDASFQSQRVIVLHWCKRPIFAPIALTPIFWEMVSITLHLQTSGMGGKC